MSNISIDPSLKTPARYYANPQSMVFRSVADISEALNEELIHHIQNITYMGGIAQYDRERGGLCNIEFEAKVLQDILCMMNTGACAKLGATLQNGNDYSIWIGDVCSWGQSMPSGTDLEKKTAKAGNKGYWEFLKDFNNDSNRPNYSSPIKLDLKPEVINYYQTAINQNK